MHQERNDAAHLAGCEHVDVVGDVDEVHAVLESARVGSRRRRADVGDDAGRVVAARVLARAEVPAGRAVDERDAVLYGADDGRAAELLVLAVPVLGDVDTQVADGGPHAAAEQTVELVGAVKHIVTFDERELQVVDGVSAAVVHSLEAVVLERLVAETRVLVRELVLLAADAGPGLVAHVDVGGLQEVHSRLAVAVRDVGTELLEVGA